MERQYFQVAVNNVPDDVERWIVARIDTHTRELWFWGSWDNEPQAREISKLCDGIVIRRNDNE